MRAFRSDRPTLADRRPRPDPRIRSRGQWKCAPGTRSGWTVASGRMSGGDEKSGGEPITAQGLQDLRTELEDLEGPRRIAMAARIKVAREEGDLKENAEYHIAKEDQAHLETRIKRLRERLGNAVVVEADPAA